MEYSPSANLISEKGILHEIKSIKNINSSSKSNGCIRFLSLCLTSMQALLSELILFYIILINKLN